MADDVVGQRGSAVGLPAGPPVGKADGRRGGDAAADDPWGRVEAALGAFSEDFLLDRAQPAVQVRGDGEGG